MSIGGGLYTGGNSYKGYIWYRSAQNEIRVTMDSETGAIFTVAESVYCNKWSQITATRSGGTYKLYVDGIQVDVTRTGSTNDFSIRTIGWSYNNSYAFSGSISNTYNLQHRFNSCSSNYKILTHKNQDLDYDNIHYNKYV